MKRFVRFALLVGVIGVSFWVSGGNVAATSSSSWLTEPIVVAQTSQPTQLAYIATTCSSDISLISIEGWSVLREACVFGYSGNTQVARYIGSSGLYLYAVKFPLDTKFTPIKGLCLHASSCVYGQGSDTFLMQQQQSNGFSTAVIPDFTQHLVKYNDEGTYFRFEYEGDLRYVTYGTQAARTIATAVSSNGKWAFVEVQSYGYVRINLETLQQKRVVAPGVQYGYGSDPTVELTISDDGTKVAIAGWRMSIAVYEVNELCGDVLTDTSTAYYSPYTYACPLSSVEVYSLFPGFVSAHVPRFSEDGSRLGLYIRAGATVKRVTITPVTNAVAGTTSSYVAFGDSFTSGEGELSDDFYVSGTNTNTNRCHVSTRSYPYLLKQRWGGAVSNRACSGSRIAQVNQASTALSATMQPADRPARVSVSIGGNDIELMGKLKTCIGPGTCEWATSKKRSAGKEEIRSLFPDFVAMLQKIQKEYPGADIAVIGYPSVVNTTSSASCRPLVSALLNGDERIFMEESIKYLNVVLRAAATYVKATFIDIKNALIGERLCDPAETAMNGLRLGDDIAPIPLLATVKLVGAESFHPTPRGHELITTAIQDMTAGAWWTSDDCRLCEFSDSQLAASSYWDNADNSTGSLLKQKSSSFLRDTNIKSGTVVSFSFPSGSFSPGAIVTFSLHSEPQELLTHIVSSDGGLSGELQLPIGAEGYHTVHANGLLPSGESIDIYQTVTLQGAESPIAEPGSVHTGATSGQNSTKDNDKSVVVKTPSAIDLRMIAKGGNVPADVLTIPVVALAEGREKEASGSVATGGVSEADRQTKTSKSTLSSAPVRIDVFNRYVLWAVTGIGAIAGAVSVVALLRKRKQYRTIEVKRQ